MCKYNGRLQVVYCQMEFYWKFTPCKASSMLSQSQYLSSSWGPQFWRQVAPVGACAKLRKRLPAGAILGLPWLRSFSCRKPLLFGSHAQFNSDHLWSSETDSPLPNSSNKLWKGLVSVDFGWESWRWLAKRPVAAATEGKAGKAACKASLHATRTWRRFTIASVLKRQSSLLRRPCSTARGEVIWDVWVIDGMQTHVIAFTRSSLKRFKHLKLWLQGWLRIALEYDSFVRVQGCTWSFIGLFSGHQLRGRFEQWTMHSRFAILSICESQLVKRSKRSQSFENHGLPWTWTSQSARDKVVHYFAKSALEPVPSDSLQSPGGPDK